MRLNVLCERVAVDHEGRLYVKADKPHTTVPDVWLAHDPQPLGSVYADWAWRRPSALGGGALRLSDVVSPELLATVDALLGEVAAA